MATSQNWHLNPNPNQKWSKWRREWRRIAPHPSSKLEVVISERFFDRLWCGDSSSVCDYWGINEWERELYLGLQSNQTLYARLVKYFTDLLKTGTVQHFQIPWTYCSSSCGALKMSVRCNADKVFFWYISSVPQLLSKLFRIILWSHNVSIGKWKPLTCSSCNTPLPMMLYTPKSCGQSHGNGTLLWKFINLYKMNW